MALNYSSTSTALTQDTIFGVTPGRSFLFDHESGTSDDGVTLSATLTSGDADIADGDKFMFIRGIIPDYKNLAGTVKMVVQSRGRQVSLKIFNDTSPADNWRFGTLRLDTKADGKR